MSAGRRAARLALTFLLGSATSKILVLALLPLYTRVLSPDQYGFYDLSVTYVTIIASILFLDVWIGTMRFMYRDSSDDGRGRAVKTGLLILISSTLIFCGIGLVVGAIVAIPFLPLIITYGVTSNVKEFYGFVARGYNRNFSYSASGAVNTILMVALNLLFLLVLDWDLSAIYVAAIVGNVSQILWLEVATGTATRHWRAKVGWIDVKEMLRFTLPLGVNSVAYWLLSGVGKLVVQDQMTLADNGFYGIGSRFGALVVVIASVFTMVWQDLSFSRGTQAPASFYGRAASFYFAFIGFGMAILIPLIGIAFPALVGDSFAPVFELLPAFLLVAALGAFSTFLGNTFYALNHTAPVLYTTLVGSAVTVGLSFPFVFNWGITGANLAAALGFLVIIVSRTFLLGRITEFAYRVRDILASILAAACGTVVYFVDVPAVTIIFLVAALGAFVLLFQSDLREMFRRPAQTS